MKLLFSHTHSRPLQYLQILPRAAQPPARTGDTGNGNSGKGDTGKRDNGKGDNGRFIKQRGLLGDVRAGSRSFVASTIKIFSNMV